MDDALLEKLGTLVRVNLNIQCPVLSGNMQNGVRIVSINDKEWVIEISAKFYDVEEWKKNKKIQFTGENYGGITDYAMWVNKLGAFGRPNSPSRYWVNRCLFESCNEIANEVGASLDNKLEL